MTNQVSTPLAIWARGLAASYSGGPPVLAQVDLDIQSGCLVAIVGPNGAGKSTLFNLIMGMKRPLSGDLRIFGESVNTQRLRHAIAYVPQHECIDWDYPICVWDVVLGGRYGHISSSPGLRRFLPPRWAGEEHQVAVGRALSAVDMLPYRDRPIGALSGGQKKRVFLARALAQGARLILLDEPFVGVDQRSERLIFSVLEDLKTSGQTILMVTHDLASAKAYADQIIMINGRVIASGKPEEIFGLESSFPHMPSFVGVPAMEGSYRHAQT